MSVDTNELRVIAEGRVEYRISGAILRAADKIESLWLTQRTRMRFSATGRKRQTSILRVLMVTHSATGFRNLTGLISR